MSRLRKGKKYDGGKFACQFKSAVTMKSPLYQEEVAVAGQTEEVAPTVEKKAGQIEELEESGAAGATVENLSDKDIVPPKKGSSSRRSGRDAWMEATADKARRKEEEERAAAEAKEAALEEKRYRTADDEIAFEDDYVEGSSGKDRRKEYRSNRKEIRGEFKDDKARIKEMRKSGEISRKEARDMKKGERAEKKDLKKANKTLKKKNRKAKKNKKKKNKKRR